MGNALLAPNLIVLALNIAIAAIALSVIGLLVAKNPRCIGLPLQHGLLCAVVILTLMSPAPIWLSYRCGLGLMTFSSANTERHHLNENSLENSSRLDPESLLRHRTLPDQPTGNVTFVKNGESGKQQLSSGLPAPRQASAQNAVEFSVFQFAGSLLIILWGIVAIWCAARLVQGLFVVRRIRQSLRRSDDPRMITAAKQAFCAASVDYRAEIFESRFVPAPLTLGWFRSSVVMPHGLADVLDDKQLASILAHEVAHIVRRDTMMALFQQIAFVLFWWNPLLRMVNHRISQLRERLCDDCVVIRYGDGMPLAESIVKVAEWSATRTLLSPLSLALLEDFSDLEDRVHRLTEEDPTRLIHLSRKSAVVVGIFSLIMGFMLLLPFVSAQDRDPIPDSKAKSESPSKDEKTASDTERKSNTANHEQSPPVKEKTLNIPITVSGSVRTEDGKPVSQATVYLVSTNGIDAPIGKTKTDADGQYQFREALLPTKKPKQNEVASGTFQVFGEADGFGIAWHGMRYFTNAPRPENHPRHPEDHSIYLGEPIEMALTMRAEKTLSGRITDENGMPVSNAEIGLSLLDYLDMAEHEYHPNFREFRAMGASPEKYHTAQTNADGRFEIKGLPDESVAGARINHPNFANQMFWVAITDRPITEYRYIQNSSHTVVNDQQVSSPIWSTRKVMTGPLEIRVAATRRVVVNVVQGEDRLPVKNVRVSATSEIDSRSTGAYGKTDERGRIELKLPPGKYRLIADPPRESDFVRTIDKLTVETESEEQSIEVRMQEGCVLVLEAVDATSGIGIPKVSFWEDFDDGVRKGRRSVQSSTVWVDNPMTNEKGELRAVVRPGMRRYGAGFNPLPDGYTYDQRATNGQEIDCEAGKTIRVQFKLTK